MKSAFSNECETTWVATLYKLLPPAVNPYFTIYRRRICRILTAQGSANFIEFCYKQTAHTKQNRNAESDENARAVSIIAASASRTALMTG